MWWYPMVEAVSRIMGIQQENPLAQPDPAWDRPCWDCDRRGHDRSHRPCPKCQGRGTLNQD